MLAFLLRTCIPTDNSMGCVLKDGQGPIFAKSGSIIFTCTALVADETVKVKLGEFSSNKNDYTITDNTWTVDTTEFTVPYTDVTKPYTHVTLAIIPATEDAPITKYSQVDVTILSTPTLSAVVRTDSTDPIYANTELTFKATISNTIMPIEPKPHIKFALYPATETKENFDQLTQLEAELNTVANDGYSFKFNVPAGQSPNNYKLIAQFIDSKEQTSAFVSIQDPFTVSGPSIDCTAFDDKTNYAIASTEVKAKCIVAGSSYTKFKAKVGEKTDSATDYTQTCEHDSTSHVITCSFEGNSQESDKVAFVLLDDVDAIIATQTVKINLIAAPTASGLAYRDEHPPSKIYREDTLKLKVTIEKPAMTAPGGKIQIVNPDVETLNEQAETIKLIKKEDSNEYSIDFVVPADASYGQHKLLFQATNLLDEVSSVLSMEVTVLEKPKLICTSDNKFLKASGTLELTCDVSENIKQKKFKYSLDGETFTDVASFTDGKLKFTYDAQTKAVPKIYIGAFETDGGQKIIASTVDVTIFPVPAITKVVASDTKKKYIVGDDVDIKITVQTFHMIEEASVLYGFISTQSEELEPEIKADAKPVSVSESEYTVSLKVPESEKMEATKYIKMTFTDKAGQSVTATIEDPISLRRTYFITSPKINSASGSSAEETKFKKGDVIKVQFILSNLLEDWEKSTKFGYKFDDINGEMKYLEGFDVVESTEKKSRKMIHDDKSQTVSLSITVPENYTIPESGKTQLYVYTLDKDNNIVSPPMTQEITFDTTSTKNTTDDGSGKLSGGAIAGIVIAVIAVVAGAAAGAFFFIKKKGSKVSPAEKP